MEGKKEFIAHVRNSDGVKQDLWVHLFETSDLAGKFAAKIGLQKHGKIIGLLHDLGKASAEFDNYIRSSVGLIDPDADAYVDTAEKKGKIDHSTAGAQILYNYVSNEGKDGLLASQILSLVLVSHHSGLIDCLTPNGEDNFTKRMQKTEEKTRMKDCLLNLDDITRKRMEDLLSDKSLNKIFNFKLSSMMEKNDSIETCSFKIGLFTRILFSCLIDADRLSTADFEFPEVAKQRNQGAYASWITLINRLEKRLGEFKTQNNVDAVRQEVSRNCLQFSYKSKGLYQLTVPTGGGKTLASLRFALNHAKENRMDRIIYVIPYTSIIDQNAQVAREIFEEKTEEGIFSNSIVLEHHSNLTPEEENTKQKLLSDNWDAPLVFTTMVQFLEIIFGYGTRSVRRMHQLANAVIIFDEIQTLPVKCVHIFNLAIRFLTQACGSTVVLCTATQPLLDKINPVHRALQIATEQKMISNVEKLFEELKRVEVYDKCKPGGWTDTEIAELAEQALFDTGSVLVVVNTKKSAVGLFNLLKGQPRTETYHLSTDMCPAHRMQVLNSIKESLQSKKPIICVSTQLIEAGVDIDFGSVVRYVAELDSIAQAAGRCNRNGVRPRLGKVYIVNPKEENLDKLEDIRIGRDIALRVLDEYKDNQQQFDEDILSPKALERYYQYYFYNRSNTMSYPLNSRTVVGREDNLFELLSTNNLSVGAFKRINKSAPLIPLRQSFQTSAKVFQAIDTYTRGVIVPYEDKGTRIINELSAVKDLVKQYHLLKEAQRYSVNVFAYKFHELFERRIIHETQEESGIFYLDEQYYSDDFGLTENPVNEMKVRIV